MSSNKVKISKIDYMTRKLERVRKVRKKDFDRMVEALFKLPPPKKEKGEREKERGEN